MASATPPDRRGGTPDERKEPNPLVHVRRLIAEKVPGLAFPDPNRSGRKAGIAKLARDAGEPAAPFERLNKTDLYYKSVPRLPVLISMAKVIGCTPQELGVAFWRDLYAPLLDEKTARLLIALCRLGDEERDRMLDAFIREVEEST